MISFGAALLLAGAVAMALVMLIFFSAYAARPAMLFSPGGLISKAAQILLEISLIALIVMEWRSPQQA